MKKIIYYLFLVVFSLACSSDKEEVKVIELSVSPSSLLFTAAGGEKLILEIKSNDSWIISGRQDWMLLETTKGEGDKEIEISVLPNSIEESRTFELEIRAGNLLEKVAIRQAGKNISLEVSENKIELEAIEEELNFDILSNDSWTIENIPDWLAFSTNKGEGNLSVRVNSKANLTTEIRESTVLIKSGSKTHELIFLQKVGTTILDIVELVQDFYSDAAKSEFSIESDGLWELTSESDWCKLDINSGCNNSKVSFSITENKEASERRTRIVAKSGNLEATLLIKQAGFISVSDNPYQINQRDNAPRAGDEIIKKQIEYVEPGASGENVVWTFDNLEITDNNYVAVFSDAPLLHDDKKYILGYDEFDYEQPKAKSLIVNTEHNTMYYVVIEDSKKKTLGHENVAIKLKYQPRMISDQYPTYFKNSYKKEYKTRGLYSGAVWVASQGYMEMNADAYGTITIEGKQFKNVIRIKNSQFIKDVGTEDVQVKDSEGRIMEVYRWFARGFRYPILELHKQISLDTGEVTFKTGFYCIDNNISTKQ